MTKTELEDRTQSAVDSGRSGLQAWYDLTPKGVRKQLAKIPEVVRTWEIYGVERED